MSNKKITLNQSHDGLQEANGTQLQKRKKVNVKIMIKQLDFKSINKMKQKQKDKPDRLAQRAVETEQLSAIRYKTYDTVKYDKKQQKYFEQDYNFVHDVTLVKNKNKNMLGQFGNILKKGQKSDQLTDQQCDEVDYIARKHYKANRVNQTYLYKTDDNDLKDKCPCGCGKFRGSNFSFCTSINKLKFLGSGTILLFLFIKAFSIIMLLVLLIYGIFSVVTNLMGGQSPYAKDCATEECKFINNSSNSNKINASYLLTVQWWLGLAYCVIWLAFTRFLKYQGRKRDFNIDKRLKSASDNALLIRSLPSGEYTEVELVQYFQKIWHRINRQRRKDQRQNAQNNEINFHQDSQDSYGFGMKSIQIIYNMEFSRILSQKIIDLCCQLGQNIQIFRSKDNMAKIHYQVEDKNKYMDLKDELIQYLETLGDLRNKYLYDEKFRKSISCELCLIEFQDQENKDFILESYGKQKIGIITQIQQILKGLCFNKNEQAIMFKGKFLHIQRAPEPSDIIWHNCEKPYSFKRTLLLYLLTMIIVTISFGLIVGLEYLQNWFILNQNGKSGNNYQSTVNIVTSIILLVINKFIWFILPKVIDKQYNYTLSEKINSIMNKSLFASSVNIIVLPIITNYFIQDRIYGTNGLSGIVFDYQFTTLCVSLPLKLIDPVHILKRLGLYIRSIRNKIIRYKCQNLNINDQKYKEHGIKVINELYEGSQFDTAEYYIYIIGTMYHTAFFCQLQPAVLILGTVTTFIFFFVLKAKLLYFSKIPDLIDLLVFQTALTQASLVPIIYGVGSISVSYIETSYYPERPFQYVQGILCIILGFIFFFNPGNFFNNIVNKVMLVLQKWDILNARGNKKDNQMTNEDTYYKKSNSMDLLGFENVIKGVRRSQMIERELKRFCEQYFPKQNQKIKKDRIKLEEKESLQDSQNQQN